MTYPPTGIVQGTPPDIALEWKGNTLHIRGMLTINETYWVEKDIEETTGDVDFDLSELTFIDDLGLASLIKWQRHLAEHGAKLRLLRTLPRIWRVLKILGMLELFDEVEVVDPEQTHEP